MFKHEATFNYVSPHSKFILRAYVKTKTILLLLFTLMFGRHGIGLLKKPMVSTPILK